MNGPTVRVHDLRKVYLVNERETGPTATMRSLFKRRRREVLAVDGISFAGTLVAVAVASAFWRVGMRSYAGASA